MKEVVYKPEMLRLIMAKTARGNFSLHKVMK